MFMLSRMTFSLLPLTSFQPIAISATGMRALSASMSCSTSKIQPSECMYGTMSGKAALENSLNPHCVSLIREVFGGVMTQMRRWKEYMRKFRRADLWSHGQTLHGQGKLEPHLDNGITPNEMGSRPDCDPTPFGVLYLLTTSHQRSKVVELARSIGISKHGVLTADMPHAVRDRAPLPSVLCELDHSDRTVWYVGRPSGLWCPWPRDRSRVFRELMVAREVQGRLDRAIRRAVRDYQDLPSVSDVCWLCPIHRRVQRDAGAPLVRGRRRLLLFCF